MAIPNTRVTLAFTEPEGHDELRVARGTLPRERILGYLALLTFPHLRLETDWTPFRRPSAEQAALLT